MVALVIEQLLNGVQLGLTLFLLSSGLTLVLGMMDTINLAQGSLYMLGAYFAATASASTGSFWVGVGGAVAATALVGLLLEVSLLRRLYATDHLTQVLATFALILVFNELVRMVWGPQALLVSVPPELARPVQILPGLAYSAYRLTIIAVAGLLAAGMFLFVHRTRLGMWVRAGASNRPMARAMGVPIQRVFTGVFVVSAALSAVAGALLGPIFAVQVGMGEEVLILAFVAIVIGGIGSVKGSLAGSLLVGIVDTAGRAFLPLLFGALFPPEVASNLGPTVASVLIYLLMAVVLFVRPQGLFPVHG
ncbi:MAG: branched-chain amino acid ABC transporter permease [candidate division GAL15 bacterium]